MTLLAPPLLSPDFYRDRSVLVTGATGLLGSWLCQALVAAQANVVALVRDEVHRSNLHRLGLHTQIAQVRGELEDLPLVTRAIAEYEVQTVFHLAAQTIVGIAGRHPIGTFEANIRGTYHLLEAARRSPLCRQVVVASTDKAYGDNGTEAYTEETPLLAVAPYDLSKACADQLALGYHRYYQLPVVVTRCGNLYGGGDLNWNRIVPGTIRSALRGERPVIRSDGLFVRDYVYVQDAVHAYGLLGQRCAEPGIVGQAFNFSDESPRTVIDLTRAVLQHTGREDLLPLIQNGATDEIPRQTLCARKARRLLSWQPRYTLDQGLSETVTWYRQYLTTGEG